MRNSTWDIKYMVNNNIHTRDNVNLDRFLRMRRLEVINSLVAKRVKK